MAVMAGYSARMLDADPRQSVPPPPGRGNGFRMWNPLPQAP
jgi:hypothetical protein